MRAFYFLLNRSKIFQLTPAGLIYFFSLSQSSSLHLLSLTNPLLPAFSLSLSNPLLTAVLRRRRCHGARVADGVGLERRLPWAREKAAVSLRGGTRGAEAARADLGTVALPRADPGSAALLPRGSGTGTLPRGDNELPSAMMSSGAADPARVQRRRPPRGDDDLGDVDGGGW